nr:SymE family type I addiction module toxin [Serratia fonticola]
MREIERLLLDIDTHPYIGANWVRNNGDLYLAGDWLTQSSQTGQPLAFSVMPGKVVIRLQQGNIFS